MFMVRDLVHVACVLLAFVDPAVAGEPGAAKTKIAWQNWDDKAFSRAKSEKKLVLLDLKAVWCHWCHVMDQTTYSQPKVIDVLNSKFIAIKVDQDSHPELSRRYEDYGWPATIVFDAQGNELMKRSGYIKPDEMVDVLSELAANPTPLKEEDQKNSAPEKPDEFVASLRAIIEARYDEKVGGWKKGHKYLDRYFLEDQLQQAALGNEPARKRARQTLDSVRRLVDPVWGGLYQYSVGGNWNEPHFEKIMSYQADSIQIYSQAYALWKDERDLQTARKNHEYVERFLIDASGAFYTSQDADVVPGQHSEEFFALNDQERRKRGIPRVDKNIYARENGWMIESLTHLYSVTGDEQILKRAKTSAEWIIKNRSYAGGGFRHGANDERPYLGDSLSMARAFVALYSATGERLWLKRAEEAAVFINKTFRLKSGGFLSAPETKSVLKPKPNPDENISFARLAASLHHFTGNPSYREMGQSAFAFARQSDALDRIYLISGLLLAENELRTQPVHITVVGGKADANARELFKAGLAYPAVYKRIEWFDRAEGLLPNADVTYPEMKSASAFVCTDNRCSIPMKKASELHPQINRILQRK
jgi:uncharacterized protein YyaL (SSP411 family)